MGIAAVAKWGISMRESFAGSTAQPSIGDRLDIIASRLEVVAWMGLFGVACLAGFLFIAI